MLFLDLGTYQVSVKYGSYKYWFPNLFSVLNYEFFIGF